MARTRISDSPILSTLERLARKGSKGEQHVQGGGTTIRVADTDVNWSLVSITGESGRLTVDPDKSVAAKAIMVSVFPSPIGSAITPPQNGGG